MIKKRLVLFLQNYKSNFQEAQKANSSARAEIESLMLRLKEVFNDQYPSLLKIFDTQYILQCIQYPEVIPSMLY